MDLSLIRIGVVSAVDPDTVRVRVTWSDLTSEEAGALQSNWLPVAQHGSTANQGFWLPDVGAQVLCAMLDSGLEDGVVIGALYGGSDAPANPGVGIWSQRFADRTVIEYDPAIGVSISTPLAVTISAATIDMN